MTPHPDKYHFACTAGEVITATGTDNGSGATTSYDLSCDGRGPGLPPPFVIASGLTVLSFAVAYPGHAGGSYVLTLTSSTAETQTYRFTQGHNSQDGCVVELSAP